MIKDQKYFLYSDALYIDLQAPLSLSLSAVTAGCAPALASLSRAPEIEVGGLDRRAGGYRASVQERRTVGAAP